MTLAHNSKFGRLGGFRNGYIVRIRAFRIQPFAICRGEHIERFEATAAGVRRWIDAHPLAWNRWS